jgi:hypothetical protein
MKTIKLFIVVFVIAVSFTGTTNAQFKKGKIILGVSTSSNNLYSSYLGGSSNLMHLGFSTMKYKSDNGDGDSEKLRTFNLSPRSGYFLSNHLAAGLDLNYSLMSMGIGDNKETMTLMGISPFIRYYLPIKKVAAFAEVEGTFGSLKDKYTNYLNEEEKNKSSVTGYMCGIGMAVPIGDIVAFDIMVGYVGTTIKDKEDNPDNYRTVLGTLGFKIGFNMYIGASK